MSDIEENEIKKVKRFLIENTFRCSSPEVTHALAILVYKSSQSAQLNMNTEYAEIAATYGSNAANLHAKLCYHVHKNYENVRDSVMAKHNYYIGKDYAGIKEFVDKMGIAYGLYM